MLKLHPATFIKYKFFNSLFTGLSIGMLFTIYEPIQPTTFSIGGIILALGMLLIAKFYDKLLNINSFFIISLIVEITMLITVVTLVLLGYSIISALLIYIGYQLTFIFGGYLVRAETLVASDKNLLAKIDMSKQVGYLVGLGLSLLFYKILEQQYDINESKNQITILHYFLILLQLVIIIQLVRSFRKWSTVTTIFSLPYHYQKYRIRLYLY